MRRLLRRDRWLRGSAEAGEVARVLVVDHIVLITRYGARRRPSGCGCSCTYTRIGKRAHHSARSSMRAHLVAEPCPVR